MTVVSWRGCDQTVERHQRATWPRRPLVHLDVFIFQVALSADQLRVSHPEQSWHGPKTQLCPLSYQIQRKVLPGCFATRGRRLLQTWSVSLISSLVAAGTQPSLETVYYNDVPVGTICCRFETRDEATELYLMTMGVLAVRLKVRILTIPV